MAVQPCMECTPIKKKDIRNMQKNFSEFCVFETSYILVLWKVKATLIKLFNKKPSLLNEEILKWVFDTISFMNIQISVSLWKMWE